MQINWRTKPQIPETLGQARPDTREGLEFCGVSRLSHQPTSPATIPP